jgi:hypothetical protein
MVNTQLRLIAGLLLCFNGAPASADVSCEQLAQIAGLTVQLRNQGEPLASVLAEGSSMQATGKLSAADMALVKAVIEAVFRGEHSPSDILADCTEQRRLLRR